MLPHADPQVWSHRHALHAERRGQTAFRTWPLHSHRCLGPPSSTPSSCTPSRITETSGTAELLAINGFSS